MHPYLVACIALVGFVGCGDGKGPGAGGAGGGGGGGGSGSGGLTCDQYAWCTTYSPSLDSAANPPALTGGTIAEGVYRLEEGNSVAEALAFKGTTLVRIGNLYENDIGTWSVSGANLALATTMSCDHSGTRANSLTLNAAFAVQGDDLFTRYEGSTNIRRWHRVTSLCATDDNFRCRVTNCACSESFNQGLPDLGRDPTNPCRM